ncbi:MAG: rRNA maturation RNase YbeY [Gammaproteobacteria bacterium]|nr:rRNA maturation RNase YbeY [Gammaproteobacteria bacterium]
MKKAKVQVDVQLACEDDTLPQPDAIEAWVLGAIDGAGRTGNLEVGVRVVDAEEIRSLNRKYRDKDAATNVLSFPAGPISGLPDDEPQLLGDIVVCASVVAGEAAEQRKATVDHWAHMFVHGTLHLLGYDHQADDAAREMEGLETRILAAFGVADPYGARLEN